MGFPGCGGFPPALVRGCSGSPEAVLDPGLGRGGGGAGRETPGLQVLGPPGSGGSRQGGSWLEGPQTQTFPDAGAAWGPGEARVCRGCGARRRR